MPISIRNIPFGSTIGTLDVLLSTLDRERGGPRDQLLGHRVLDVYQDPARKHDRDGWFMVCVENEEGERKWVQAPPQQVEAIDRADPTEAASDLPVAPTAGWAMPADLRPGDRIRQESSRVEGTVVSITREHDVDADWLDVPGDKVVIDTVDGNRGTLTLDAYTRVEREGLFTGTQILNLRQVPPGTAVRLTEAYEPVRPANFPAPSQMFEGIVKDIRPADAQHHAMLVYMTSAEGEGGWLKVPAEQRIVIIELEGPEGPVPDAPWDLTGPMPAPTPASQAVLSGVVPGTVVSGLNVYTLDAVTGLSEDRARVLENTMVRDINALGVEVDGREMVILSLDDGKQESVMIAEASSIVTCEYGFPVWAEPSPVRLAPMSEWPEYTAHHTPVLAQGTNMQGEPASFYGTLSGIQPVDDGWVVSIAEGTSVGFVSTLRVPEDGLARFEGQAGGETLPLLPATYLKPGQTIVNDDGARAVVIANQAERAGVRTIVVQLDGVGVNGVIEVPSGKLFAVENSLATLTPDEIEYEMSVAMDIQQMPADFEEAFTAVVGTGDSYTPGLG